MQIWFWNPHLKNDIEMVENVQCRATIMVAELKELNYEEQLRRLKLPTLAYRRARGDETFKFLTGKHDDEM